MIKKRHSNQHGKENKVGADEAKDESMEEKESDGLTVWGVLCVLGAVVLFVLVGGAILYGIAYGTAGLLSWGVPHIEALASDLMCWTVENPEQANVLQFFLYTFVVGFVILRSIYKR